MRYEISCHDCPDVSESTWLGKAMSDAWWHNTGTGHDAYVVDTTTDLVEFDLADIDA